MRKMLCLLLGMIMSPLLAQGQLTSVTKDGSSYLVIEKIWDLDVRLGGGNDCDFHSVIPVAQEQATRACPYESRFDHFEILSEREAFVAFCTQGGDCGWSHQCIVNWKVTCLK